MGIGHVLLLLMYLDPLGVLAAATPVQKKPKPPSTTRKPPKTTQVVPTTTLQPRTTPAVSTHDTCLGYYDVSGQYDKMFECNNTDHRYCCGTCFLRFCCEYKKDRLNQKACDNYQSPKWVQTAAPSPVPTGDPYDPSMDQTNTAVYITCGVIAFIIVLGVSAKVAYDKATEPPQEMNIHRALADILRQQGPIPISQYDCENFAAMNGSPKDNTPIRTSSKNHYTPVHTKTNHGLHYGKDSVRSSGGVDLHNFISSGFVTLGRGHQKGDKDVEEYYTRKRHLPDLAARGTLPLHVLKMSQELHREPQQHQSQPPQQSMPQAPPPSQPSQQSSSQRQRPRRVQRAMSQDRVLTPQSAPQQDYSISPSGMSPIGMSPYGGRILSDEQLLSAERLRSQERLLPQDRHTSQDRLYTKDRMMYSKERLSQEHLYPKDRHYSQERLYSQDRLYSQERLYSHDRLLSQDPLLSPDRLMMSLKRGMVSSISGGGFRGSEQSISRAISHTDVFIPTTPIMDRYKMTKMHSHPSASNNGSGGGTGTGGGGTSHSNTLAMNQTASKRQAFASRRTHTVEQLHYVPQQHHQQPSQPQHYRTGSKTEVTV